MYQKMQSLHPVACTYLNSILMSNDCFYLQMKGLPEAWSKEGQTAAHLATNMSRPNSLFGHHSMTTGSGGSESAHDLKDLYLQDLSDGSYLVNPLINGRNPRIVESQPRILTAKVTPDLCY